MRRAALLLVALAAGLAGCASTLPAGAPPNAIERAVEQVPRTDLFQERCAAGSAERLGDRRRAYAVSLRRSLVAYTRPGGASLRSFGRMNQNGVPTVLGVLGVVRDESCEPAWFHVQLPVRPNGATGYVRADAVDLHRVSTRIVVDLSERTIVLLRDGRAVLRSTVAIGSDATPTPTGTYYVNQRLRPLERGGPYGPAALGVSAFSPVLTGWAQGGPIGIHGTNAPSSIGRAVSNGCIRVPNRTLERLYGATPAGTPVVIRA